MKTYFNDVVVTLPQLVSRMAKNKDKALILSTLIHLTAQQRAVAHAFNIAHTAIRLGWIIDPITVLLRVNPTFKESEIKSLIREMVEAKMIFVNKSPYAVLLNAEKIEEEYNVTVLAKHIPDPIPTDWNELSQQEFWDKIPGISTNLPKINIDDYVKKAQPVADWANQYRVLDNAPVHVREASKMISDLTGYLPESKDWISAVHQLYSAASNDMDTLRRGLLQGNEVRKSVPFSSIRSYLGSVRDVAAKQRVVLNPHLVKRERITV